MQLYCGRSNPSLDRSVYCSCAHRRVLNVHNKESIFRIQCASHWIGTSWSSLRYRLGDASNGAFMILALRIDRDGQSSPTAVAIGSGEMTKCLVMETINKKALLDSAASGIKSVCSGSSSVLERYLRKVRGRCNRFITRYVTGATYRISLLKRIRRN